MECKGLIGFKVSPFISSEAHLVHSYCAVSIMKRIGLKEGLDCIDELRGNGENVVNWVMSLKNENNSLRGSMTSFESDLRMVYSGIAYLSLLELLPLKEEF